jgi:hypothetical protein
MRTTRAVITPVAGIAHYASVSVSVPVPVSVLTPPILAMVAATTVGGPLPRTAVVDPPDGRPPRIGRYNIRGAETM